MKRMSQSNLTNNCYSNTPSPRQIWNWIQRITVPWANKNINTTTAETSSTAMKKKNETIVQWNNWHAHQSQLILCCSFPPIKMATLQWNDWHTREDIASYSVSTATKVVRLKGGCCSLSNEWGSQLDSKIEAKIHEENYCSWWDIPVATSRSTLTPGWTQTEDCQRTKIENIGTTTQ